MSADVLRQAAALMRERAEATEFTGRWETFQSEQAIGCFMVACNDEHTVIADPVTPVWAEHIASWHPAVALAVADWLDAVAADFDIAQYGYWSERALAVARAYVGDQP